MFSIITVCIWQTLAQGWSLNSCDHSKHHGDHAWIESESNESMSMQLLQVEAQVKRREDPNDSWDFPADQAAKFAAISAFQEMHVLRKGFSKCQLTQALLPSLLYLVLGLPLAYLYFRRGAGGVDGEAAVRSALYMSVFAVFVENLMYSIWFVDSVDFISSISLDLNSGTMIGIQKVGTALGTFVMFLVFLKKPTFWRKAGPSVYTVGFAIQIMSAATFATVGLAHAIYGFNGHIIQTAVNVARLIGGFGGGLQIAFGLQQSAHLVTGTARFLQNTRWYLGACFGMGLGPLLGSAAKSLAVTVKCGSRIPSYEPTLVLTAFLPLVLLPAFSRLRTVADAEDVSWHIQGIQKDRPRQILVVLTCLTMQVLRSMTMAAIEAAASDLLREEYGWSRRADGVATAMIIFTMLPMQVMYEYCHWKIDTCGAIRTLLLCAFMGTVILKNLTVAGLLLGCMLILPAMALSSGLIMGVMQDHALPHGSAFDLNKITLLSLLLSDAIGRGLGPSMARRSVELGGQSAFASGQMILTGITFLLNVVTEQMTLGPKADADDQVPEKEGMVVTPERRRDEPGVFRA